MPTTEISHEPHRHLPSSEVLKVLDDPGFWNSLKLERLLADIDPIVIDAADGPSRIFIAFGKDPHSEADRQELQTLLEALGHLFLQSHDSIDQLEARLPSDAQTQVRTDFLKDLPGGPSRINILRIFIVHKMLARGNPRRASNLLLTKVKLPSRRTNGVIDDKVWSVPLLTVNVLTSPMVAGVKTPGATLGLAWERSGKSDTIPSLLRQLLERYFVHVLQYKNSAIPKSLLFTDLPEIYQTVALDVMNVAERLPEAARKDVLGNHPAFAELKLEAQRLAIPEGIWTSRFIDLVMKFAFDNQAHILKHDEMALQPGKLSTETWEKLLHASLSDRYYWIYRQGIETARLKWKQDLGKERQKLQNVIYVDLEQAYQYLIAARTGGAVATTQLEAAAAHWALDEGEKTALLKEETARSAGEWNGTQGNATTRSAAAAIRAQFLAHLIGVQIHPMHRALFENDPAVRLATLQELLRAEKDHNEERKKVDFQTFKDALRPEVRDALFSVNTAAYPIGARIIESYRATNLREVIMDRVKKISQWTAVVVTLSVAYSTADKFKPKFDTPPITESQVWKLTRQPIVDPTQILTDSEFQKGKQQLISRALADGLSEPDVHLLSEFVHETKPDRVPEAIRGPIVRMQAKDKNDPDYRDFDDFKGWTGKYTKDWIGRSVPVSREIRKKRSAWLNDAINIMRVMVYRGNLSRSTSDAELSNEIAPALQDEIKKRVEEVSKSRKQAPPVTPKPAE